MTELPLLFTPLQLRDLELKNRIVVSPMATYSARDGFATDRHSARKVLPSVHGKAAGRSGRPISTPAEKDRGRLPPPAAFRSTTAGRLPTC
jgi:hypothetical protein